MARRETAARRRSRLADPVTHAAADAAQAYGRTLYGQRLEAVVNEWNALIAGRDVRTLAGADAVQFMALRAKFDALAVQQKQAIEAEYARRLRPDDDGGDAPAPHRPTPPLQKERLQ